MFPRLCQRSACSNAPAGRHRPDRQSRLAQEPENQESDRGRGRRTAFPAALLARPEPDRDGFFEIEDAPAQGFRMIRRSPLEPHRRTPPAGYEPTCPDNALAVIMQRFDGYAALDGGFA